MGPKRRSGGYCCSMGFLEKAHHPFMALNGMILIFLLAVSLIAGSQRVEGGRASLSREEDLELDRQLNLLNKPAIKTIQTEYGQIFDCVDIHKQPAFDHPLLKNHKIQFALQTTLPGEYYGTKATLNRWSPQVSLNVSDKQYTATNIWMGDPIGNIEIGFVADGFHNTGCNDVLCPGFVQVSNLLPMGLAIGLGSEYNGTQYDDDFTFYKDPESKDWWLLFDRDNRRIGKRDGKCTDIESIVLEAYVNPTLYLDSYTHLHSYWTANGFHNTGCDDVLCPGFVQVSKSLPLGMVLKTSCEYNGTQIDDDFTVFKDPESKDWWLLLGPNRRIGYWPKNLFHSEFADYAKTVQWGGEVFNAGTEAWPPMGSGRFPDEGYTKASYIGNIQLIDKDGKYRELHDEEVITYVESRNCYSVMGPLEVPPVGGYYILFGGPGGKCPE
ncbi:protein neprosin-like [Tasmannia lanceolata]|uniref:protein neprosin-like n=1 Tax=Tasmannia lanceolata TaxID=3420 RepID=UPI0040647C89